MKKLGLILLFSASALISNIATADITPVVDVTPEYPQAALRRDITGHVVVQFDVDANGKARNITIVDARPARIFNGAVRTALMRSTFKLNNDDSLARFQRTYHFDQNTDTANLEDNRFNFMEVAPQMASN